MRYSRNLAAIVLQGQLILDFDDFDLLPGLLQGVRNHGMRRLQILFEIRLVGRRYDDGGTLGRIRAHAACMVHMVVGEDEILDGFAGILCFRGIDDPLRLRLSHWSVKDCEAVLHSDDQIVGAAGHYLLNIWAEFHQLWRRVGWIKQRVGVEKSTQRDPSQHPLIGNIAISRGCSAALDRLVRYERDFLQRRRPRVSSHSAQDRSLSCR